ncbi:MAG: ArsA family ATPase [Deltaproteobacteria bacterium]|nr:ArsA family ATPase [Deltaproteobacteria bacterium]
MGVATPSFLIDKGLELLLFGGKGGVGKTTCAAASAIRLANAFPKDPILLVSTDPAHSLHDSLANLSPPHNLKTVELDAQACLETFNHNHRETLRQIALRGTFLDDEDISQFLDLSLPGLDELMAFLEISKWVDHKKYRRIVVDTAPTGHTLRLLAMPDLIRKWLDAIDALLGKHRYMRQLFSGSCRRDELDAFLLEFSELIETAEGLLTDPLRCRFVPVMLAETLSIQETLTLIKELERLKVPATDVIVNKLYPEQTCPTCADGRIRQLRELGRFPQALLERSLWGLPIYPEEVRGGEALESFWDGVTALDTKPSKHEQVSLHSKDLTPIVEFPAHPPSPEQNMLLFAGKGGVGKTTLACATAVFMARSLGDREIFLFSTDPAHSLSVCLDVQIGPQPTTVIPGLTAMEIDAQAEFEGFKSDYAEELERFLDGISQNLDLAFDREVMERIIDLSPPGLDEVMALTLAVEFLAEGKYDVLILDSAPTGHLVRLLETPELITEWLKVFFNLFLKYKHVFRLPKISQRLVQMSKDLKQLRSLLRDRHRSALFAVAISTEMALEETKDLVKACERIGIHVPALFLNLATPAGQCPLCSALSRHESKVRDKFEYTFSKMHHTVIYRRGDPRGLRRLGNLGEALFNNV